MSISTTDLFLQLEDAAASGGFMDVGGFRSNDITLSGDTIETTDIDSGNFRTLADEASTIYMDISANGIIHSQTALARVMDLHLRRKLARWRIDVADLGRIELDAMITNLSIYIATDNDRTYSLSLSSSGAFSLDTSIVVPAEDPAQDPTAEPL